MNMKIAYFQGNDRFQAWSPAVSKRDGDNRTTLQSSCSRRWLTISLLIVY